MRLQPLGDHAVLIQLGEAIDEATHAQVRAVCARLDEHPIEGMIEYVPAFASVAVYYDPAHLSRVSARPYDRAAAEISAALAKLEGMELPAPRTVEIPVCYGGELGPDLEGVARYHGLSEDEVVAIHAEREYLVHMIGFMPGFAYLGGLDERIVTPRRSTPRPQVAASSVGIGGQQTGIYPIRSPGGWQIIGRTPLRLFTPEAESPTLLRMGDRVRFRAIPSLEPEERERGG